MKNKLTFRLLSLLLITGLHPSFAQVHDFDSLYKNDKGFKQIFKSSADSKNIFDSEEIMNITIESDFKNLVKRKYKDEYQPAIFRYYPTDTVAVTRNITIKPRGNMRKGSCFFPPLKLNFAKKETVVKQMKEFDKMKMVLDCKRGNIYEQYLVSEYYAYKVLNILTDYSFRVRLIRVTYVDTSEKYKTAIRYAFLIENKEELAQRLNAIPIDNKNVKDTYTDVPTLANANLFQYLIGNTDWSIPARHNIQMIKSKDPMLSKPYVIPYDFDYAGIVNTDYAVPDENLGTKSVRERVYRGVCIPEAEIKKAAKHLIDKKEEIYLLYQDYELLDKNNNRNTLSYLDEFYRIIESENGLKRNILDACR
jgi:hypothetical protein